jgi:hypothetical protein
VYVNITSQSHSSTVAGKAPFTDSKQNEVYTSSDLKEEGEPSLSSREQYGSRLLWFIVARVFQSQSHSKGDCIDEICTLYLQKMSKLCSF